MTRSELEWLGFEMAVRRQLMISPVEARLLTLIVRRPGMAHTPERLSDLADLAPGSLKALLSHVREALRDMGFSAKLRFHRSEGGYRLSPGGAEELWGRVLEELELAA